MRFNPQPPEVVMIRTASPSQVSRKPIELTLSREVEERAGARIFAGRAPRVGRAEAIKVNRFMRANFPAGRVSTRVVAGELFVLRGQVYFRGLSGPGQPPRLLNVGTLASLTGKPSVS